MNDFIHFQDGLLVVYGAYFIEIKSAILAALIGVAVISDIKSRRIPNWLVFSGAVFGIAYQSGVSYGPGVIFSLEGMGIGLVALLPLYALRAMGAGDVKLMAMIGAYLGPLSTLEAVIATLIAGGVLGIAMAVWKRSTAKAFRNVQLIMTNMMMKLATNESAPTNMAAASAGKLPYAVAIAAGTATHMLLLRNGYALII